MTMFVILCDTHDSIIDQDPSLLPWHTGLQWCANDVPKILRLCVCVCVFLFYILFTSLKCSNNFYNHICHGQNDKYDWTIIKYVTMFSYFNYVVMEDDVSEGK